MRRKVLTTLWWYSEYATCVCTCLWLNVATVNNRSCKLKNIMMLLYCTQILWHLVKLHIFHICQNFMHGPKYRSYISHMQQYVTCLIPKLTSNRVYFSFLIPFIFICIVLLFLTCAHTFQFIHPSPALYLVLASFLYRNKSKIII